MKAKKYVILITIILSVIILIYFLKKSNYDIVYSVDVSDYDFTSIESFCLSADNKYLIINAGTFSKSYQEVPFQETGKFDVQEVSSSTSSLLLYDVEKSKLIEEYSFLGNSYNNFYTKKNLEDYKTSYRAQRYDKIIPLVQNQIGLYTYKDYENGIYFSINNKGFKLLEYEKINNLLPYPYADNNVIVDTKNRLYTESDTLIIENHKYFLKRIRSESFLNYNVESIYNENDKELLAYTIKGHKTLIIANDLLINIYNDNFQINKIFLDSIQAIFSNNDSISSFLSYKIFPNHFICTYYNQNSEQKLFIFEFNNSRKILIDADDFRINDTYVYDYLPELYFDKNQNYLCIMSNYRIKILDLKTSQILFDKENGSNLNMGFFNRSNKIRLFYKTIEYSWDDDVFKFLVFDLSNNKEIFNNEFAYTDPSLSFDDQYLLFKDRKSKVYVIRTNSLISGEK